MNELWDRWGMHYFESGIQIPGQKIRICRDGIIVPHEYQRILFVLRETNDWAGGDIRDLLRDGPRYQVWHTVGRWAAGLLNDFPSYDKIDNWESKMKALRSIAAINLKKASGGNSSDPAVINAYAYHDRHLLREQIALINPRIIVACGTFDSLVWLMDLSVIPDFPRDRPVLSRSGTWVLPWVHPSRVHNEKTYNSLESLWNNRGK